MEYRLLLEAWRVPFQDGLYESDWVLFLDVYNWYRREMSSLSFKSLSSHSKPEVDCKVTDVWVAAVVVRHWRLGWMNLE